MNAHVVGKALNEGAVLQNELRQLVELVKTKFPAAQDINIGFGQTKHFPQFPNNGAVLKGNISAQQSNVRKTLKDVAGNVVAIGPRKIDVEIGRILAVEVDEALKIQIELDGIHVGNPQNISNDAVGTAPSPYIKITFAAGVMGDVPIDEKVGNEVFLFNDLELLFNAGEDGFVGLRIAVMESVIHQATNKLNVLVGVSGVALEVFVGHFTPKVKGDLALCQERFALLQHFGEAVVGGFNAAAR